MHRVRHIPQPFGVHLLPIAPPPLALPPLRWRGRNRFPFPHLPVGGGARGGGDRTAAPVHLVVLCPTPRMRRVRGRGSVSPARGGSSTTPYRTGNQHNPCASGAARGGSPSR